MKALKNTQMKDDYTKEILFILSLLMILLLSGCASNNKNLVVKTEYKDVYVPIRCEADMPPKPNFNHLEPKSAGELINYYLLVEDMLKGCIDAK